MFQFQQLKNTHGIIIKAFLAAAVIFSAPLHSEVYAQTSQCPEFDYSGKWQFVNQDPRGISVQLPVYESSNPAEVRPGYRYDHMMWTDKYGKVWLFGGQSATPGYPNTIMNDVWKFDPDTGYWTCEFRPKTPPYQWPIFFRNSCSKEVCRRMESAGK